MSLASFAMFTGGGLGTALNGVLLTRWGYETLFVLAGVLFPIAGVLTTLGEPSSRSQLSPPGVQ